MPPRYGFGNFMPPLGPGGFLPEQPAAPQAAGGLAVLQPGALPIQAGNLRAPPILISPLAHISQTYTDNPRGTPGTLSDTITRFGGGTLISYDTVHLQGQLTGSLDYQKYARATDQDTLNVNLLGYGLGTIVRDHVLVDGRAAITQFSRTGGIGFASNAVIPPSQQTQVMLVSLTPIVRGSFSNYIDAELRYNVGVTIFQDGSLLNNTPPNGNPAIPPSSLGDTTQNAAMLTLATGRRFTLLSSTLSLSAANTESQSSAKSSRLGAVEDIEYQINTQFAALGRIGYMEVNYPRQTTGNFNGGIYRMGGRFTPFPGSYLTAFYGRQESGHGFEGALRYQLTPLTTVGASLERSLATPQQQFLNNLNISQVNPSGMLVNRVTGLPLTLTNPEVASLTSTAYRNENAQFFIQTMEGRNTFGTVAFVTHRTAVGNPTGVTGIAQTLSGNDTAIGANFSWGRSLTPRLSSQASVGYVRQTAGHQNTLTANLSLSYTLSERFRAGLYYQMLNIDTALPNASYYRNQIEIGLTANF
jgi:hypothetical protein